MVNDFEGILSECIDRIVKGGTVEECLQRYPEHAPDLEPLLQTAAAARQAGAVQPRPEFKAAAGYRMRAALRDKANRRAPGGWAHLNWLPRWAGATALVLVILIFGATGTVAAASNTLPGDMLHPVKLAGEHVQMAFTFSDEGKAKLYIKFADKRADELVSLAAVASPDLIEQAAARLTSNLESLQALATSGSAPADAAKAAELEQDLVRHAARSLEALDKAQEGTQDSSKEAVGQARDKMLQGYNAALDALQQRGR